MFTHIGCIKTLVLIWTAAIGIHAKSCLL